MYHAIMSQGGQVLLGERPSWIKMQSNGVQILCSESEAQGIIIDDETYHIHGREEMDAPTVHIIWQDDTQAMVNAITLGGESPNHGEVLKNTVSATRTLFTIMAESGGLDDATIISHALLFSVWNANESHYKGCIRRCSETDEPYRCIESSKTKAKPKPPSKASNYWAKIENGGGRS